MVQESATTVVLPFLTEKIVMHMQGYCEIPTTSED
jgi:hypothetical protein